MAKYKNVSGQDFLVPHPNGGQRLVVAGALHDEDDFIGDPAGMEANWQLVKPSKAADSSTPKEG